MKTQHTPGPWHVERGERCLFIYDSRNDVPSIAHLGRTGMDHDDEANARLIASAPELLEALEALLAHEGSPMQAPHKGRCFSFVIPEQAVASARAAINAAKGETL